MQKIMEFSEQVLVLHTGAFRETDIWLRLLSPSRGIFSAFAFGGSRSRQRFIGCLDIFNQVLFRIKSSRGQTYLALQEGVLIKGVSRIKKDWTRLGIAKNCVGFLQAFGVGADGAAKAHLLTTDLLDHLEEASYVSPQLPLFFRLRLAADQGYALDFDSCTHCGAHFTKSGAVVLVREGAVCCSVCALRLPGPQIALAEDSLEIMRHIQGSALSHWGSVTLGLEPKDLAPHIRRECCQAIDGFIQYHVGLSFENGYFRKL